MVRSLPVKVATRALFLGTEQAPQGAHNARHAHRDLPGRPGRHGRRDGDADRDRGARRPRALPWAFASYLLAATVTVPSSANSPILTAANPSTWPGSSFSCSAACSQAPRRAWRPHLLQDDPGSRSRGRATRRHNHSGDIFELEARARIQGLFGAVWGISAVVGPAAGGFITDLISWRWVFYVNVPFGIIAAVLLAATLTESFERRERSMDYLGTALLTGGLVAVLLALLGGGGAGELSVAALGLFFGGLAVLALFVLVERRAEDPVVPLDLFSERIIAVSALGNVAMGGVLLGVAVYVPLFVQGALGGTAITAGAAVASLSIGWPVGSFVGGRLLLLTGYRATLLLGSALIAIGSALCVPMDSGTSLSYVVFAVVVIGLGLGFSSTSYLVSVQNAVPWRRRGVATSSVVFFRTVGVLSGSP